MTDDKWLKLFYVSLTALIVVSVAGIVFALYWPSLVDKAIQELESAIDTLDATWRSTVPRPRTATLYKEGKYGE